MRRIVHLSTEVGLLLTKLDRKIPPLLYWLLLALIAWALAQFMPGYRLPQTGTLAVGLVVACLGVAAALTAAWQFARCHTTLSPLHPQRAQVLVTSGMFRLSRNPMYLGMLLLLLGWVFVLGGLSGGIVIALFIAVITRFQILPEERMLLKRFGDEFLLYKNKVRRWI